MRHAIQNTRLIPSLPSAVVESAPRILMRTLERMQFLSQQQMLVHQRALLERLIRYARVHVPFYRDRKQLNGLFRTGGEIDWDRWQDIPILSRQDVQRAGDALRSRWMPPEHGPTWTASTSGSTGEPVRIAHSYL